MGGRKTSLTPETRTIILDALRLGHFRKVACQLAGIHPETMRGWAERARNGEEPFASFIDDATLAEAEGEDRQLKLVQAGAPGWQSNAWVLERRHARRWCARVRQHITEELGSLTAKLQTKLDADTMQKVIDATREDDPGDSAESGARH